MKSQRFHIIIDVSHVENSILNDAEAIKNFLGGLPAQIGMSVLYGPIVVNGIPENPGVTGFVIIDYSHISLHSFTKYNEALVDIFSCKPYDQEVAKKLALDFFKISEKDARIKVVYWGE
jgi:S-adenosylmethionine decarboxylase